MSVLKKRQFRQFNGSKHTKCSKTINPKKKRRLDDNHGNSDHMTSPVRVTKLNFPALPNPVLQPIPPISTPSTPSVQQLQTKSADHNYESVHNDWINSIFSALSLEPENESSIN